MGLSEAVSLAAKIGQVANATSLNQIRELLILRADHVPACSHVKELLDQKLTAAEQKITELRRLELSLKRALRKCKRELKMSAPGHENCCPVLAEITRAARREAKHEN
jgi:DNA-binding transcriptional MerR regulator